MEFEEGRVSMVMSNNSLGYVYREGLNIVHLGQHDDLGLELRSPCFDLHL